MLGTGATRVHGDLHYTTFQIVIREAGAGLRSGHRVVLQSSVHHAAVRSVPVRVAMHVSRSLLATVLFATVVATSSISFAGSVCGTVRDALTNQPVPQAAIFLFDNASQYTGLYAGTDVAGHYCVNNVPDGTYTLQVKVDNYITATVPNVVVTTTTGVDVDVHPQFALAQPWPNPASTSITFRLQAAPDRDVTLDVFDVAGRRVYGWRGRASLAGERTVEWNLRDFNGNDLQSGIYFVRLNSADGTLVRRFVRLR
jgi:Carboxypeptidase regulatory-like domain/Secretion system C-terminal sorting domain